MLARIRNSPFFPITSLVMLMGSAFLTSCATKEPPPLLSTGAERESTLPWNKQEQWENAGQFGSLAETQSRR